MSAAQIDTTSIYGALSALTFDSPDQSFPWAIENLVELLSAAIHCDALNLAPLERAVGPKGENLGQFVKLLSDRIPEKKVSPQAKSVANKRAATWVASNMASLQRAYKTAMMDESFDPWIKWSVQNSWFEHCKRLGGMCHPSLVRDSSEIMRVDTDTIDDINRRAANPKELGNLIKHDTVDFQYAKGLWTASIQLRGVYYHYLSSKQHFLTHQVRGAIFPRPNAEASPAYRCSVAELYLVAILIASIYANKGLGNRMEAFADYVKRTRHLILSEKISLDKDQLPEAENAAILAARELGVSIRSKALDRGVRLGAALAIAGVTNFLLDAWPAILFGAAEVILVPKGEKLLTRAFSAPECTLRALAKASPGLMVRNRSGVGLIKTNPFKL